MKKEIIHIAPGQLTLHPLLWNVPMMPEEGEDFQGLIQDVLARGVDQPLIVDEKNRIMDGRHRWRAATLAEVDAPCIVESSDRASDIILHSLVNRRHMTKGCQAYVSYPVIESLIPKPGPRKKPIESVNSKSRDEICADLGFSPDTLEQAAKLHELFNEKPHLPEKFEPSIMAGAGLGGILAGIAGLESTEKKPRADRPAWQLLQQSVSQLELRFDYWGRLESSKRHQISSKIVDSVLKWPDEVKDEIRAALAAATKQKK